MKKIGFIFLLLVKFSFCQTFDHQILKSINAGNMPCWDKTMRGLSFTVYPLAPVSVLSTLSYGYLKKDKVMIRNGYKSLITIGLAVTLSTALKYAVQRERPYVTYTDIIKRDSPGSFSFPSGHTTAAFATATSLSLSHKKWYITVPSYLYAGFVGYSRMRLGVHYPSDVLAGALLGIGSGLLTWKIDKLINRKKATVEK